MTPPRSVTQDQWLDQVTRRRTIARRLWYGYVRYPRRWAKQFIRFLLTTPGKMTTMVVLLSDYHVGGLVHVDHGGGAARQF